MKKQIYGNKSWFHVMDKKLDEKLGVVAVTSTEDFKEIISEALQKKADDMGYTDESSFTE